jgi:hypothetical protein
MGMYAKYTPIRVNFDLATNLTPSNKKLGSEIRDYLLPLTNYLVNGQYVLVQPIASKFAERCICSLLTTN